MERFYILVQLHFYRYVHAFTFVAVDGSDNTAT